MALPEPQPCGETRRCIDGQCLELDCLPQDSLCRWLEQHGGRLAKGEASVRAVVENHPQVAFGHHISRQPRLLNGNWLAQCPNGRQRISAYE